MQIRTAIDSDIPEILHLLYLSRGEQLITKTADYWNWKHLQNPFGPSPVLLAEEKGELIGIRTMMQWQWQKGDKIYKTLRAVDTATHPHRQGRGIFTHLTKAMVEHAKLEKIDFIFNTPNHKSRPGYLKMGWKDAGRISVGIKLSNGFDRVKRIADQAECLLSNLKQIIDINNEDLCKAGRYFTPKSEAYLTWRYQNNPVITYTIFQQKGIFIAAYIKKGTINELRISECISDFSKSSIQTIKDFINSMAKVNGAVLVSCSPYIARRLGGAYVCLPIGPLLTVKDLNDLTHLDDVGFSSNKEYIATLGDLELF